MTNYDKKRKKRKFSLKYPNISAGSKKQKKLQMNIVQESFYFQSQFVSNL